MRHFHHFFFMPAWHVFAPWGRSFFAWHGDGGALLFVIFVAVIAMVGLAAGRGK